MKKILSITLTLLLCLSLSACGNEEINGSEAFESFRQYLLNDFENENYYIQISKTQAEAHTMTEISKLNDDCAFLVYDATGSLKFFRNGKNIIISSDNYYTTDEKEAKWSDFSYGKTAENYRNALYELCQMDYSKYSTDIIKEIIVEKNENENFPYKVSIHFDLSVINAQELFGNGGNFGSLSIKFLCSEDGKSFDDISLNIQYDYNSEIYVIAAYYGDPNMPDENGSNGQRPEDIQEIFDGYVDDIQKSLDQYLESMQSNY